jgi:hypothetical protein
MGEAFKAHLQIAISAAERTRGILYFFALLFAAMFAVIVDVDFFNWTSLRQEMISNAFLCYTTDKKEDDKLSKPYGQEPCGAYYEYIATNYHVLIPPPTDYPKSWEPLTDRYKSLTQAFVDSAYTTIPILSMKVEKNNVFIFALLVDMMALATLRLSIGNEISCVKHIIPLINSQEEINAVLDCHVFAKPRSHSLSFWWFLFIPAAVGIFDLAVNFNSLSIVTHLLSGSSVIGVFYILQIALTVSLCVVSWLCFATARSFDRILKDVSSIQLPVAP